MKLYTRLVSLIAAILITAITLVFLKFVPNTDILMLFVAGSAAFISSYVIMYIINDLLIINEINKIFDKLQDFEADYGNISRKKILKSGNPIKKLDSEIANYIQKREAEISDLKALETLRKEFVANVSHELKTPIFAAQGYINTLIDGAMNKPEVAEKFLKKAANSIDNLENLVSDILIMSKAESGKFNLEIENIEIIPLINQVLEGLAPLAITKNIKVDFKHQLSENLQVRADYTAISQVIKNLVENAIKYNSLEGSVKIKIKESEKNIQIEVIDNGPGIAEQDIDRIFERFYRVEKSRSRATGGTGLGLAIVKHMLLLHGTQIKVKSALGKGSQFMFTLEKAKS
jgi:two-component system, OmpR family, phosphate regulon sensor histidine kinase PhoR